VSTTLAAKEYCDDEGTVCTEGGHKLANRISAVVMGPPGLSVAGSDYTAASGTPVAPLCFCSAVDRKD